MVKSPEAFRTISEVSEWLDRPTHVLRFWESKFPQIKPVKRAGGRRYYRPQDMLLLGGIKRLLHDDGLTIKGVQKMLREQGIAHVAGLSQPLDDDLAAVILSLPAPFEAPMDVMAEDSDDDTGGAQVLAFPDTAKRDAASPADAARPVSGPGLAPPPPATSVASLATTHAPASMPKPHASSDLQPSLPFDAPDMPPVPAALTPAPIPSPEPAPEPAPDAAASPVPQTALVADQPPAVPQGLPQLPADDDSATAPATATAPGLLAGLTGWHARPLPPQTRAALLPLVRRLVPVARAMREPPVSPE